MVFSASPRPPEKNHRLGWVNFRGRTTLLLPLYPLLIRDYIVRVEQKNKNVPVAYYNATSYMFKFGQYQNTVAPLKL